MEKGVKNRISIVIPVYYNELNIHPTFDCLKAEVVDKNKDLEFEIIFVDDGSKDTSLEKIMEVKKAHPNMVKVIKLTKNFGQCAAVSAGFENSSGEFIVNIDADLQDPPQLINEMIHYFHNENHEILVSIRLKRKESLYRRVTSRMWYSVLKKMTFDNFPIDGFNFFGISHRVRDVVMKNVTNSSPFTNTLLVWTGFPIKFIPYTRNNRDLGKSRYTFAKKIRVVFDNVVSFSDVPVRMAFFGGIIMSFIGFVYAGLITLAGIFGGNIPFKGWAPIMITILIISGFQLIILGLLGEYLIRTLQDVRKRDMYIIEKIYE